MTHSKLFASAGMLMLSVCAGTSKADCLKPVFNTDQSTITKTILPGNCSPAVTFGTIVTQDATDVLTYRLTGATIGEGSGTGSGSQFNLGTTHVLVRATSACGEKEDYFFDVVVKRDNIVLNAISASTELSGCGAAVNYVAPKVADVCPGCTFNDAETAGFVRLADFQGHTYFRTPYPTDWHSAEELAKSIGGHLVTINSRVEDSLVNAMVPDTQRIWFGLTDEVEEGTFKWISGEEVTYTNWCWNNPDNYGGQDYGLIHSQGTYPVEGGEFSCWDDAPANIDFFAVVEVPTCTASLTLLSGPATGTAFPVGKTTVVYQVNDGGNSSTVSFDVNVNLIPVTINATAPDTTFTGNVPTNIYLGYGSQSVNLTVNNTSGLGNVTWTATGGTITVSNGVANFAPSAAGSYVVTATIKNAAGTCTAVGTITICVKNVLNTNGKIWVCEPKQGGTQDKDYPVTAVYSQLKNGAKMSKCGDQCPTGASLNSLRRARMAGGNELTATEVSIYPNPTANAFFVELPQFEKTATVTLMDVQGKVIDTRSVNENDSHKVRFDLANSPVGMYLIEVSYNDQRIRSKMVRQ